MHVIFVKILTMLIASSMPHFFKFPDVLSPHHLFLNSFCALCSRKCPLLLPRWCLRCTACLARWWFRVAWGAAQHPLPESASDFGGPVTSYTCGVDMTWGSSGPKARHLSLSIRMLGTGVLLTPQLSVVLTALHSPLP